MSKEQQSNIVPLCTASGWETRSVNLDWATEATVQETPPTVSAIPAKDGVRP